MPTLLLESKDKEAIASQLEKAASEPNRLRRLLSDLTDRLDELSASSEALFYALLDVGDRLISRPIEEPPALHDHNVLDDLSDLIWEIIKSIEFKDRAGLLRRAFAEARSTALLSMTWERLALTAGIYPFSPSSSASEAPITADEIISLGIEITQRANAKRLEGAPLLGRVLRIIGDAGDDELAGDIANDLINVDAGLASIVDGLMSHGVSSERGPFRSLAHDVEIPGLPEQFLIDVIKTALSNSNFGKDMDKMSREITLRLLDEFVSQSVSTSARKLPPNLNKSIGFDSINSYAKWKFPNLEENHNITQSLIRDLDHKKYKKIGDIDNIIEQAIDAVDAYRKENPETFTAGVDFITKSLGFVDETFRNTHKFSNRTLQAFEKYKHLLR